MDILVLPCLEDGIIILILIKKIIVTEYDLSHINYGKNRTHFEKEQTQNEKQCMGYRKKEKQNAE